VKITQTINNKKWKKIKKCGITFIYSTFYTDVKIQFFLIIDKNAHLLPRYLHLFGFRISYIMFDWKIWKLVYGNTYKYTDLNIIMYCRISRDLFDKKLIWEIIQFLGFLGFQKLYILLTKAGTILQGVGFRQYFIILWVMCDWSLVYYWILRKIVQAISYASAIISLLLSSSNPHLIFLET